MVQVLNFDGLLLLKGVWLSQKKDQLHLTPPSHPASAHLGSHPVPPGFVVEGGEDKQDQGDLLLFIGGAWIICDWKILDG